MNRNDIAIKGSVIGIVSQFVNLAVKFVVRTFIIRYLGMDILGLDSVLIDTISMLSLAEMGITSSMLFRLYAPVVQKDQQRMNALMATYRRVYYYIAVLIAGVGIIISFVLPKIVNGVDIPQNQIYVAFYLQLACAVSSYLLAYQRILLNADQKKHICLMVDLIANVAFSILKVICILAIKSYTAYLALTIIQTVFANLVLRAYARKLYPSVNCKGKPQRADLIGILADTKDLLGNKLAGYVYNSTDNLIISIFLGTGTVGLLSNYKYLSSALRSLVNSAMSTMQPLIGNYLNSDTKLEDSFAILRRYTFVRYLIAGMIVIPFVTMSDVIIRIWTGDSNYVLGIAVPILIAMDFYIGCVYGPLGEYILGMGLFKKGKYATFAGAICNAALSLICVQFWGILGVLIPTVIGQLVIWIGDGIIILKGYYGERSSFLREYVAAQLEYFAIIFACCIVSIFCSRWFGGLPDMARLVIGIIFDEMMFVAAVIAIYHRRDEYNYLLALVKNLSGKVLGKTTG